MKVSPTQNAPVGFFVDAAHSDTNEFLKGILIASSLSALLWGLIFWAVKGLLF